MRRIVLVAAALMVGIAPAHAGGYYFHYHKMHVGKTSSSGGGGGHGHGGGGGGRAFAAAGIAEVVRTGVCIISNSEAFNPRLTREQREEETILCFSLFSALVAARELKRAGLWLPPSGGSPTSPALTGAFNNN